MTKPVNCPRCGKLHESDSTMALCPECYEQDLMDFDRIREYLFLHPGAKIFEVSNNLNISIFRIKRYLREGRLEIIEKNNAFLKCEICGRPICSGNYCDDCVKQATHDYKTAYTGNTTGKSSNKLNYLSAGKLKKA